MILIKDDNGKPYWVKPEFVAMVTASEYVKYRDDQDLKATELWFTSGMITIEAPMDEIMSALKPRVRA